MSALLDSALRYARHGLHVFPCRGKAPLTPNGLHAATCHTAQIRAWFGGRRPDPNVAIRTGAVSDLVALDIDGDDGWESLRRLEARYDVVPRTASVKTPRGGSHYWFRHPGGTVANSASTLGPCLDIRGDGGYVVAPPSI